MKKGFTLVEILVSLFFLTLVMTSFVSVVVISARSFRASRALYLGSKIAEDGIELVVNKRDNNVLCVKPGNCSQLCSWKQGLLYTPGGSCNLQDQDWNVDAVKPNQLLAGNWFDDYNPSSRICVKPASQNKFGVCTTETPITGNYNRKVTITDVPGLEAVNVKSTVTWTVNGAPASVTLEEMLFGIDGGNGGGGSGDLVGWWKLDENPGQDGTIIADWSGSGNNGTFYTAEGNTNKSGNGVIGRALNFDGVDDRVGTSNAENPGTSNWTVSAWVKTSASGGYVAYDSSGGADKYILSVTGGKGAFSADCGSGTGTITGVKNVSDSNWHLLTGVRTGANSIVLYVDGINERNGTFPSGCSGIDVSNPFFIGSAGGVSNFFNGMIDDVRVYNRALSEPEILYLFSLGVPDTVPPSAPTGLSANAVSYSQINLSWADSTDNVGIAGYKVERCQGSGCSSFVEIGTPSDTSFSDTGLTSNTTYNYRVRATDAAGNLSGYSSVAGATTQIISCSAVGSNAFFGCYYNSASPGAFTALAATRADTAINFNWGTGSPDPAITSDLFSARWEGDFNFYAGNNTFTAVSDDGIRFYIDGVLIPFDQGDGWKDQLATTYTATQSMTAGTHRIKVEYYENGAEASAQFSWLQPITGLVGWWKMDENPAIHNNLIADSSGSGNNGTLLTNNGSTNKSVAGQIDRAVNFDGNDDNVNLGDNTSLRFGTGSFTIAAWIKPATLDGTDTINSLRVIGKDNYPTKWWVIDLNDADNDNIANVEFEAKGDSGNSGSTQSTGELVSVNAWTHIVIVYDRGSFQAHYYGNGVFDSTQIISASFTDTLNIAGSNIYLGSGSWNNFNGLIDDVRIYNRALSASEIQTIYDGGESPSVPTNLTATPAPSSRINLSWTASTDNVGVTGYRVERCEGSGCSSFVQIATPIGASFSDSGVVLGESYSYRVRAADAAGNLSGYSSVASATAQSVAGLAGWWRLDDGIGSLIAADSSGNGNTGTLANGPAWTAAGQISGALIFDGTDDRINLGSPATLDNLQQKTLSLWVNYSSIGSIDVPGLVDKQDGGSSGWLLRLNPVVNGSDLRLRFVQNFSGTSGEWSSNASTVPYDSWAHVVVTYDKANAGNQPSFYVNGSSVASSAITSPAGTAADDSAVNAYIGDRSASDNSFKGSLDDVRVYNGILSPAEIQIIYDAGGVPSVPTGLTATPVSSSQINLSWTASTDNVGVTDYKLERCAGSGCTSFAEIAAPSGTSYSNSGLTAGTSYRYRVRANDATGNNSDYSQTASAMTQPASGLAGWWKFDGSGADTIAIDDSGNLSNGTLCNGVTCPQQGPTWVPGIVGAGNALSFDGNDYVDAGDIIDTGTTWTASAWVNVANNSTNPNYILGKCVGSCTMAPVVLLRTNGTELAIVDGVGAIRLTGLNIWVGQWNHVVVTASGAILKGYVNGVEGLPKTMVAGGNNNNPLIIGANGAKAYFFKGSIDDVRIYSRILTPSEIQTLCNMGTGGCPVTPSLIPQSQMSIASVDSEQSTCCLATNAIDGNTATIWHTQYTPTSPPHPHQITINLGGSYSVVGLKYLPRQSGGQNGTIISYNVYVSTDGVTWGSAVSSGSWPADTTEKIATFSAKTGSFVKLVANSEIGGNAWTSAAEINIFKQ
ncbi:MAG: LamG-like jellyroll fold domain-containing protein [bacterium]|nr:LamG-like jellyroll fold domain-containing protein [bacterium]